MAPTANVTVRPAVEEDLLALAGVGARAMTWLIERYRPDAARHATVEPADRVPILRHVLSTGAIHVAERDVPVGFSAAIIRDGVWFLSQFWVVPELHGQGIGSRILDESVSWGRGCGAFTVLSSPYPGAVASYMRRSMYPLWTEVEISNQEPARGDGPEVRELAADDQAWIDTLDRDVRGIARPQDHAYWRQTARGMALVRNEGRAGYVYVHPDGKVGPVAAHDASDIRDLISAGRRAAEGPTTFNVPSANWTALQELIRLGYSPGGSNTFMASARIANPDRYVSSGGALG